MISIDFQCGARADLTILLMPSFASIGSSARVGDVSSERVTVTGPRRRGRGCRSSVIGEECSCSVLFSGGDRFGEYPAGGNIGSTREVSGRGEPERLLM